MAGFICFQICGGLTFPVHRNVLSVCSETFSDMFSADTKVSKFNITSVDPEILSAMLEFVYCAKIAPEKISLELLAAADFYGIKSLIRACERHLIRRLTCKNVVDTLVATHGTSAEYLWKAASILFLQEHFSLEEAQEVARLENLKPEAFIGIVKVSAERAEAIVVAARFRK